MEGDDPDARHEAARELRGMGAKGAETLAWLLEHGESDVQLLAAQNLRRLGEGARAHVPVLLRVALSAGEPVRLEVIGMLGRLTDDRALPVLTALLENESAKVARASVEALGEYGERAQAALPVLVRLLGREDEWVGDAAAEAIGRLGPAAAPAVPALVAQLDADDGAGTSSVLEALTGIGPGAKSAIPAVAQEIVRHEQNKEDTRKNQPDLHVSWIPISSYATDALVAMGEDAIPALIELLDHELWGTRFHAMSALRAIGAPAQPALLTALGDENALRRTHAAEVLSSIASDDDSVLASVAALLADPDTKVRSEVADVLHRFGPASLPHLVSALSDPDVCWAAARSLGGLNADAAPAVPALEQALASPIPRLRRAAAGTLGRIGPAAAGAGPALGRALDDDDEDMRETAAAALGAIGPDIVPVLLDVLQRGSDRARSGAAAALAGMKESSGALAGALLEALDSADAGVRWRVAVALSRTGAHADRAIPVLMEALGSTVEESDIEGVERTAAVAVALGAYGAGGATALDDLIVHMRRLKEKHFPHGYAPLWASKEIGQMVTVIARFTAHDPEPATALLSDEDEYMRGLGRDALAAAGASAVPHLAQVARGGPPQAQTPAVEALGKLAKESEDARAVLASLMRTDGERRAYESTVAYYRATEDAETVVPIALDLVRTSEDAEIRGDAAWLIGYLVKSKAAFAVKEIRAAMEAATDADVRRRLRNAVEEIQGR
jgi:HEAT repeat protein